MRNLWHLLVRNHVFMVFVVLQLAALSWVARSHGYPRGVWVRWGLAWTGAWNAQLMVRALEERMAAVKRREE